MYDSKHVANIFNNYFLSVMQDLNINQSIPNHLNNLLASYIFKQIYEVSIFVESTTEVEVVNTIHNLKNGYSSGRDCISSRIIKKYLFTYSICLNI